MNLVYWGNSDFSIEPLKRLSENHSIKAVVTMEDSYLGRGYKNLRENPVKNKAQELNIPVIQVSSIKNNEELLSKLRMLEADLFVLVSFGKMIPKSIYTMPPMGMINLHASLLPKLRGASPIQFALLQGLFYTGNTVQYIVEGMDEGDILSQEEVKIDMSDDYFSLEKKLSIEGAKLLSNVLKNFNQLKTIPQDEIKSSYTSLIYKKHGEIFFSMTAEEIMRAFKAFRQFPGIYFYHEKLGNIKIIEFSMSEMVGIYKPGTILKIDKNGILIATHKDAILLQKLKIPGKKTMGAYDIANGLHLALNDNITKG